jgi:hypothetical protein
LPQKKKVVLKKDRRKLLYAGSCLRIEDEDGMVFGMVGGDAAGKNGGGGEAKLFVFTILAL